MDHNLTQRTSVSTRLTLRLQQSLLIRYLIRQLFQTQQHTNTRHSYFLRSEAHPYQASVKVSRCHSADPGAAALRFSNLRMLHTLLTTSSTFLAQVRSIMSSQALTSTIVLLRLDSISEWRMTLALAQFLRSQSLA